MAVLVHVLTATGGILAVFMIMAIFRHDLREAFLLTWVAAMIDYVDGSLARMLHVRELLPEVDGQKLDVVVDFSTNALVPALLLWCTERLPRPAIMWVSLILLVAVYRYSKTWNPLRREGLFFGLPVLWVFVTFYVVFLDFSRLWAALLVSFMALLAFAPVGFVHVAKFPKLRAFSALTLGLWWICFLVVTQNLTEQTRPWLIASIAYPVYYMGTAVWFFAATARIRNATRRKLTID